MKNVWILFLVGLTSVLTQNHVVSSQRLFAPADDLYIEGHTSGDLPIDDEDAENDWSGSGSGNFALIDFTEQDELVNRFLNRSRISDEVKPLQPQPTSASAFNPRTTAAATQEPPNKVKDSEPTSAPSPDAKEEKKVSVVDPEPTTQKPSPSTTETASFEITPAAKSTKFMSNTKGPDIDNSLDQWNIATTVEEPLVRQVDNDIETSAGRGGRLMNVNSQEEVTSENLWERTEVLAAVIACGVVGFLCAVLLLLLLAYRMKKKDEGSYDLGDTKLSSTAYQKAPTKEFYA